jgi:hypothetical protein
MLFSNSLKVTLGYLTAFMTRCCTQILTYFNINKPYSLMLIFLKHLERFATWARARYTGSKQDC